MSSSDTGHRTTSVITHHNTATALTISTDRAAADLFLNRLLEKDAKAAPVYIATAYALRNKPYKTFEWLDRAWNTRDSSTVAFLCEPFFSRFKNDLGFAAFCRKVALPPPAEVAAPIKPTGA